MLGNKKASTNLAVKDLDRARKFYEGTLGLKPVDQEGDELVTYQTGDSTILVYRSDYAGTNQATALTWASDEPLEQEVKDLKAKGVTFEHYDVPGMEAQGDMYAMGQGDFKIAWFKDPDGNILAVTGR